MDGPWTQFAPAAAPPAANGPWTQFAAPSAAASTSGEYGFAPAPPAAIATAAAPDMTPGPDAGLNEYGITGDPQQFNQTHGVEVAQPIVNVAKEAVAGAKGGFGDSPLGMSPKTDQALVDAGVLNGPDGYNPLKAINRAIVTPLAAGADLVSRGGAALMGAYQRGVSQAGTEVGAPQLGRDLAALPEAFPTGDVTGGMRIPAPEAAAIDVKPNPLDAAHQSALDNMAAESAARRPNVALPSPLAAAASPAFVPPGAAVPLKQRILDLIAADDRVAQNKPAFVPPDAAQPLNPLSTPAPRTVPSASDNPLSVAAAPVSSQPINSLLGPTPVPRSVVAPVGAPAARATQTDVAQSLTSAPASVPPPTSVGAAASRDLTNPSAIAMSPREAAASQATGENWRLAQPAVQGIDKTEYVPGVIPTAAEVAGNADVSAQQKYVMQTPGQAERYRAQQAANNDARIDHYDTLAGTPTIVDTLKEARSAQADTDLKAAWGNKAPVDAQPIVDQIDSVLAGPQGKLSAVSSALNKVRDTLHDASGNLETDPEVLYGARREVAAMLGKAAQQEKPTLKDAASQLGNVKDALDQTIEQGAPGYRQYLTNYTNASRPIDVREMLLDARPGLTNGSDRTMSFAKVDRLMRDIVAKRQSAGVNPAKSIDDATMEGLWNLHSDLKRLGNVDLGKPRGSDTSALGRMGGALGLGAAHIGANALLPVAGSFLVNEGKNVLAGRSLNKRVNKLMDGPNYKP